MVGETHPKGTVPTDNVPEVLEEPLLHSSSFFSREIPLVSLKVFTLSAIGRQEEIRDEFDPPGTYQKSKTGLSALVYP